MKTLVYEIPGHDTDMLEKYKKLLEGLDFEVITATSLEEAVTLLTTQPIEFALIHHDDYSTVDTFKAKAPQTTYIGISMLVTSNAPPGRIGEDTNNKMRAHYDKVAFLDGSVVSLVQSLKK